MSNLQYKISLRGDFKNRPIKNNVLLYDMDDLVQNYPSLCEDIFELFIRYFHSKSKFIRVLRNAQTVVLFEEDNHAYGMGFLSVHFDYTCTIDYICVDDNYRGRGVAQDLVNMLLREARAEYYTSVKLVSRPALRGLYEGKLGFTVLNSEEV